MTKQSEILPKVGDIAETTVPPPKPDHNARAEQAQFSHNENMQKVKLGIVGWIWGSRSEKPGNISAIVAIILVIYLGVMLAFFQDSSIFKEVFAGITSIITLILGYLFGSSDRS